MRIYQVESGAFKCDVQVTYNHNGILVGYSVMNPEVSDVSGGRIWLSINETEFLTIMKDYKMKVIQVHREITFKMFWDRYGVKVDKALVLEIWNKLPNDERIEAFDGIGPYETWLKAQSFNRSKKDPVRYLRRKIYRDRQ